MASSEFIEKARRAWVLIGSGLFVFLGVTPFSELVSRGLPGGSILSPIDVGVIVFWGFAVSPLVAGLLYVVAPHRRVAPTWVSATVIVALFLLWIFATVIAVAFFHRGWIQVTLIAAAVGTIGLASINLILRPDRLLRASFPRSELVGLVFAVAISASSLLAIFATAASASRVSQGDPYCIGHHDRAEPIASWTELRGLYFFTIESGFKYSSSWYFHGAMIVKRAESLQYFNWSPRNLRFEPLGREADLIFRVEGICEPRDAFLGSLPLF